MWGGGRFPLRISDPGAPPPTPSHPDITACRKRYLECDIPEDHCDHCIVEGARGCVLSTLAVIVESLTTDTVMLPVHSLLGVWPHDLAMHTLSIRIP